MYLNICLQIKKSITLAYAISGLIPSLLRCFGQNEPKTCYWTNVSNKYLLQITLLTDRFASVRIAAFNCITECVKAVTNVPLSDANIFPEYILPNLVPLCNDRNDLVRAAFASR